jgi:hypothetical protein
MTTVVNPAPKPFPVAVLSTDSGPLTVPCEPVNDSLAITAEFAMDESGAGFLLGTFLVTHLGTGRSVTDGGCVECARRAGKALAALPVDWSTLTQANVDEWTAGVPDEAKRELAIIGEVAWACDAEYCESDDEGTDTHG